MGNRWIKIAEEKTTTFASHEEYTTPSAIMDYTDFSMRLDQGNTLELTSGRIWKRYHWFGPINGRSRLVHYAGPDFIGLLLKGMYGTAAAKANDGGGRYKHMFTVPQNPTVWKIWDFDSDLSEYRYSVGNIMNSLSLDFPAQGVAAVNAEWPYADEAIVESSPSAMGTLPSVRPFMFFDASISLGGSTLARAESFRVNIRRSIPEDSQVLGHRDRQYRIATDIEETVEMDIQHTDWSYLKKYYGTSDPLAPADEDQTLALILTVVGPATGGAGVYANYKWVHHLPAVVITGHEATKTRRDRKMETVTLEAIYNASNCMFLFDKKATWVAS